jgi:hypothetical protein
MVAMIPQATTIKMRKVSRLPANCEGFDFFIDTFMILR